MAPVSKAFTPKLHFMHGLVLYFGSQKLFAKHLGIEESGIKKFVRLLRIPKWAYDPAHPATIKLDALCWNHYGKSFEDLIIEEGNKLESVRDTLQNAFRSLVTFNENYPERKLLSAVVTRAILDTLSHLSIEEDLSDEANSWLQADNPERVFSFAWICEQLNIEMHPIRKGLSVLQNVN